MRLVQFALVLVLQATVITVVLGALTGVDASADLPAPDGAALVGEAPAPLQQASLVERLKQFQRDLESQ